MGQRISKEIAEDVGQAAVHEATPLRMNAYKFGRSKIFGRARHYGDKMKLPNLEKGGGGIDDNFGKS